MIAQVKKTFLLIVLQVVALTAFGQAGVGIGVTSPDPSAALHVQPPTNNKGMLIPRLTTDERNLINPAPSAEGLLVYDTDINALYHFNGTWQQVGLPQGSIIMWSGTTIPAGWALCDGSVIGRPDLRDKFIMGSGGTYATGATGGASSVVIQEAQMPKHDHNISDPGHNHTSGSYNRILRNQIVGGEGKTVGTVDYSVGEPELTTSLAMPSSTTGIDVLDAGNDEPINITPPFYALAFIIKL